MNEQETLGVAQYIECSCRRAWQNETAVNAPTYTYHNAGIPPCLSHSTERVDHAGDEPTCHRVPSSVRAQLLHVHAHGCRAVLEAECNGDVGGGSGRSGAVTQRLHVGGHVQHGVVVDEVQHREGCGDACGNDRGWR